MALFHWEIGGSNPSYKPGIANPMAHLRTSKLGKKTYHPSSLSWKLIVAKTEPRTFDTPKRSVSAIFPESLPIISINRIPIMSLARFCNLTLFETLSLLDCQWKVFGSVEIMFQDIYIYIHNYIYIYILYIICIHTCI